MKTWYLSVIILLSSVILLYLAIRPVFVPYLTGTADGFAHKFRLVGFHESLNAGIFRPRWLGPAVLGFGVPLFIFNYSVPYYIVDVLYRTGMSIQTASQMYAALTIISAAAAMYAVVFLLWGRRAGLVASVFYTFAPYHLFTVYSYEAWGEMLAFTFPPLILYFLIRLSDTKGHVRRLWFSAAVLSWILFFLTHNISSYLSGPAVLLFFSVHKKWNKTALILLVKTTAISGLIAAFFLLPAVSLTHTIRISELMKKEGAMRSTYMIRLTEQIRTSFEVLTGRHIIYEEFTIGVPLILTGIAGTLILFIKSKKRHSSLAAGLVAVLLISLLLTDPVSDPLYIIITTAVCPLPVPLSVCRHICR